MFDEFIRGVLVASIILFLSIFCLYTRLVPGYYFAAVLLVWLLYSAYRLFLLFVNRKGSGAVEPVHGYAVAYWSGAVVSSLLAILFAVPVSFGVAIFLTDFQSPWPLLA